MRCSRGSAASINNGRVTRLHMGKMSWRRHFIKWQIVQLWYIPIHDTYCFTLLCMPYNNCQCTLGPKRYFLNHCASIFEILYFFTKSQMYKLLYCTIFVKRALDECSSTFCVRTFCVLSHRVCAGKVRKPLRPYLDFGR